MRVSREEYNKLVISEMRKVYSEKTIDHAMNPRNVGVKQVASGYASVTGECGDIMEMWINIDDGVISEAVFMTDGCGTTIASGSIATEMIKGKAPEEAMQITQQDILDALDDLPEASKHCAQLAASTIKEAISNYYEGRREPWKRVYKK